VTVLLFVVAKSDLAHAGETQGEVHSAKDAASVANRISWSSTRSIIVERASEFKFFMWSINFVARNARQRAWQNQ